MGVDSHNHEAVEVVGIAHGTENVPDATHLGFIAWRIRMLRGRNMTMKELESAVTAMRRLK